MTSTRTRHGKPCKVLTEQDGWSVAFAQGYVEGETWRLLGRKPALHALVGIDQGSLGFRAGYFGRQNRDSGNVEEPALPAGRPGQVE